ncbi:AgaS family sugar isomerase [Photorhabdus hindustanensis]|uniref:Tagatose-6-phosphate ketose isomerase n=1 Tax=Photorhabdus hindustanensis TaxID=2918802 RepID=A0A2S8PYZ0_9GAMM|nr:AgaS family sugar isomerase [Photorhabdus hindustanensis]PQQ24426.1 tagatose-6-phosphate ketose isomerase [Photorhabdus hindustanensis]
MNELFSYTEVWLREHHALHTAREIHQQPELWRQLYQNLQCEEGLWRPFLQPLLSDPELQIVLCGAGSSAFIGRTLAPWLREQCGLNVVAYSTTDIVPSPLQYLDPTRSTLLISYGRSGNSPESVAAVKLADQLLPRCYHLMLTCNPGGALARYAEGRAHVCSLNMPQGAHDQSFAMTSSFSCMTLATVLLLGPLTLEQSGEALMTMIALCERERGQWQAQVKRLACSGFKRMMCLGSSCFTGIAEEGALKMLELTAGHVATRYDSSMGVRHGPKFMIERDTLVVMMLSADQHRRRYDLDLWHELNHDGLACQIVALSGTQGKGFTVINSEQDDIWLLFPYLIFLQMLAFETSLALGITPDNPCPTGEVNRVVKGVEIYPYHPPYSPRIKCSRSDYVDTEYFNDPN